jgi:hypothetical protein
MLFLDETGLIAHDRFLAIGCLKLSNPAELLRNLQRLRDQWHFYDELHWTMLRNSANVPFYTAVIELVAATVDARFACFVADRDEDDPIDRFGDPWRAYERLASQLVRGNVGRGEIVTVLADNYSTPAHIDFEGVLKRRINNGFQRLAVTNVCRLDSRSTDGLQAVDLLLGAVTHESRSAAGRAGTKSHKGRLSAHVRDLYRVATFVPSAATKVAQVRATGLTIARFGSEKKSGGLQTRSPRPPRLKALSPRLKDIVPSRSASYKSGPAPPTGVRFDEPC